MGVLGATTGKRVLNLEVEDFFGGPLKDYVLGGLDCYVSEFLRIGVLSLWCARTLVFSFDCKTHTASREGADKIESGGKKQRSSVVRGLDVARF